MTVTELLPQLHSLSRDEKLKVIKFLVHDLETEELDSEDLVINESVFLSPQDWEKVTALIDNPSPLDSNLFAAVERYQQEVND
ncbi:MULTISPECIES: hypothetical protein [Spirulina sp. CCY15215]|uniref:hypothetical protein n=1 Tax=Spirulina sp. CCY15215 TaxID=2767591 RepID=UPI0019526850|nr:hypothetical protein [Spirulina major]